MAQTRGPNEKHRYTYLIDITSPEPLVLPDRSTKSAPADHPVPSVAEHHVFNIPIPNPFQNTKTKQAIKIISGFCQIILGIHDFVKT